MPYRAPSLPDELLGNWLSRLIGLNSQSTLMSFAGVLGIQATTKSSVADPVNGGEYVHAFAPHLGFEPAEALSKFTTRNYRLAFANDGVSPTRIPTLSTPFLRLCPACVRSDLKEHGVPYFHRAHQLKSRACDKHGLLLLERCPDCATPICSAEGRTFLRMVCQCGSGLSDKRHDVALSADWHRLAKLSARALDAHPSELEQRYLVLFAAQQAIKKNGPAATTAVKQTLEASFGADGVEWLLGRPGHHQSSKDASWRFQIRQLPPQLCLAVLAACHVTFDEAVSAVRSARELARSKAGTPEAARAKAVDFAATSISEAKRICLEYLSRGASPSALRYNRSIAFWRLVLRAPKWLIANTSAARRRSKKEVALPVVPSVEDDRKVITVGGRTLPCLDAKSRAFIRDWKWFAENSGRRVRSLDRVDSLAKALKQARTDHLRRTDKPTKWTLQAASQALGISHRALSALTMEHQQIRVLVPETVTEFRMRKMAWCITVCEQRGLDPTLANIRSFAPPGGKGSGGFPAIEVDMFRRLMAARPSR